MTFNSKGNFPPSALKLKLLCMLILSHVFTYSFNHKDRFQPRLQDPAGHCRPLQVPARPLQAPAGPCKNLKMLQ